MPLIERERDIVGGRKRERYIVGGREREREKYIDRESWKRRKKGKR